MKFNIKDMTAEQIADAKAQIEAWEARQQTKKLAWKPEYGEHYTCAHANGSKNWFMWDNSNGDNDYYKQGSVMTKELADYTIETRAIIHQIHEWIDENDAERGGRFIIGEDSYQIIYRADEDELDVWYATYFICNPLIPCFSSIEKLRQCVKDVGEERIKLLFKRYEIVRGDV